MGEEYRQLRERYDSFRQLIDRVPPPAPTTERLALQIYDGGNMPTSGDHYFLGHVVQFGAPEVEGGTPTQSVDLDSAIPVDVLGTNPPAVDDIVIAVGVGGRWVAEHGGSGPCCNWPCANDKGVPEYFDIVDPIYGPYRIPLIRQGGTCRYSLDTYLAFAGQGDCPAAMVPCQMRMIAIDGLPGVIFFQIQINPQGIGVICQETVPPPAFFAQFQTNCEGTIDWPACTGFIPLPPPKTFWIPCPTNVMTFPIDVNAPSDCTGSDTRVTGTSSLCSTADDWTFTATGRISAVCAEPILTSNSLYMLWGPCPCDDTGDPLVDPPHVDVTWTVTAGPRKPIGCHTDLEEVVRPPSIATQVGTAATALYRAGAAAIAGNPVLVDAAEHARRLAICHGCEYYDRAHDKCAVCGCVASWKSRLAQEHCPLSQPKW
jgi:hypothetical protein